MKGKRALIVLACLAVSCLVLFGCGRIGKESKEAFAGTWNVYSVESEDSSERTSPDDIALMRQMGLSVVLNLSDDGTASMNVFGEVSEGEWKAKGSESATISMNGQKMTATLSTEEGEEGLLRVTQGKGVLVFERVEAEAKPEGEPVAESQDEASETDEAKEEESDSDASEEAEQAPADDGSSGDYYPESDASSEGYDSGYDDGSSGYEEEATTATTSE